MPSDTDTVPPTTSPPSSSVPAEPAPPSPRVRRFWKVGGAVVAVVLLPFGAMNAVSQLAHEEHTYVDEFDASGVVVIEVDNPAGAVRVAGSNEADGVITVTTRVSDGLRSTGHRERIDRQPEGRIDGDRLVLDATCPILFSSFCEVTYTVETPSSVDVVVRGEGSVSVQDIDGDVDVGSEQATLDLTAIDGSVRAHTDQGTLRATGLRSDDVEASSDQGSVFLRFVDVPRQVVADSDQGDVEIVVPDDDQVDYRLETETDQGGVTRDIRTDPTSDRTISATTDQGDIILRYP